MVGDPVRQDRSGRQRHVPDPELQHGHPDLDDRATPRPRSTTATARTRTRSGTARTCTSSPRTTTVATGPPTATFASTSTPTTRRARRTRSSAASRSPSRPTAGPRSGQQGDPRLRDRGGRPSRRRRRHACGSPTCSRSIRRFRSRRPPTSRSSTAMSAARRGPRRSSSPVEGTPPTTDDMAAITTVGLTAGHRGVGVLWSNQTAGEEAFYFAAHTDGDRRRHLGRSRDRLRWQRNELGRRPRQRQDRRQRTGRRRGQDQPDHRHRPAHRRPGPDRQQRRGRHLVEPQRLERQPARHPAGPRPRRGEQRGQRLHHRHHPGCRALPDHPPDGPAGHAGVRRRIDRHAVHQQHGQRPPQQRDRRPSCRRTSRPGSSSWPPTSTPGPTSTAAPVRSARSSRSPTSAAPR